MKKAIVGLIVACIVLFGLTFFLTFTLIQEVKKVGLKNIIEDVWEGTENPKEVIK